MRSAKELIEDRLAEAADPVVKAAIDALKKLYDQKKLTKEQYEQAVKDFMKNYKSS